MPFIRSKACHEACSARIQKYLERDGRAIAQDFINLVPAEHPYWAEAMDSLRIFAGNDKPKKGKPPVTYRHFVISPDPQDKVGLEDLREYTLAWASHFFGMTVSSGETYSGSIGNFQVAITYHDDNASGIPHAHVIVSNTEVDTLKRMRVSNKRFDELHAKAQELAEERGWKHFSLEERPEKKPLSRPTPKDHRLTKEERSLRSQGRFSWKQDLAEHVHLARRASTTEAEFVDTLRAIGVGARLNKAKNDYVFAHPANPKLWISAGHRCGKRLSEEELAGVAARNREQSFNPSKWVSSGASLCAEADRFSIRYALDRSSNEGRPRSSVLKENIIAAALSDLPDPTECSYGSLAAHGKTVVNLNHVLAVCDREWIRSDSDFERVKEMLGFRLEKMPDSPELASVRGEYEARLADLEIAQAASLKFGVLAGVADAGKWIGPPRAAPLKKPKNSTPASPSVPSHKSHSHTVSRPSPVRTKSKSR